MTIINQVGGGVAAEAEQALNNIGNILAAAGGGATFLKLFIF